MTESIRMVIEFAINPGKIDEVKEILTAAVKTTQSKDQGALSYEFFFNSEETKYYTFEWYKDSPSVLKHIEIAGEHINKLFTVSQATRFEVFGNPSDELTKALDPFSAVCYSHWGGFTR